ncbi:MAG: hypothetical protein ACK47M_20710, partial [Caldilinea sp.]
MRRFAGKPYRYLAGQITCHHSPIYLERSDSSLSGAHNLSVHGVYGGGVAGTGVAVGERTVSVGVLVAVDDAVGVGVLVGGAVGVTELVDVGIGVRVLVAVAISVGVTAGGGVGVAVGEATP